MKRDIPMNDKHAVVAGRIEDALKAGELGEPFNLGSMEFSRVRSCCDWLIERKPDRGLFTKHLTGVLRIKNASERAFSFAEELEALGIVREPVTDPAVIEHIRLFHEMQDKTV